MTFRLEPTINDEPLTAARSQAPLQLAVALLRVLNQSVSQCADLRSMILTEFLPVSVERYDDELYIVYKLRVKRASAEGNGVEQLLHLRFGAYVESETEIMEQ